MPKSKNRRKSKGANSAAGAEQTTTVLEGEATASPRSQSSGAAPKKASVSPIQFFQQVRAEMQKVTWTTRGEVMVSTIMVLIMVTIMSMFFFAIDQLLRWIVPNLLSINLF